MRRWQRHTESEQLPLLDGQAAPPSRSEQRELVPRQFPAKPTSRGGLLTMSAEENTARLRRDAAAERIILAARRERKSDDEIREQLAAAGLEWPR